MPDLNILEQLRRVYGTNQPGDSIKKALGKKGEIVRAEDIVSNLRIIKSKNEIGLIKKHIK